MALLWRQVGRWLCGVDSGPAGVLRKVRSRPETPGEVVRLALWSMEAKQTNGAQEKRVGQPRWEGWAGLRGSSGPWGSPSPASPASALKLPGLGGALVQRSSLSPADTGALFLPYVSATLPETHSGTLVFHSWLPRAC